MTYDFLDATVTVIEVGGYFVFNDDFHYMTGKEIHIDEDGHIFTSPEVWEKLRPPVH
jgi:hypothetical protein